MVGLKAPNRGGVGVSAYRRRGLFAAAILTAIGLVAVVNAAGSDSAALSTPQVVVKETTQTRLLFTWPEVSRVAGYDLYLGLVHVGPTTFAKADFRNLACNTQYVLRVTSFDSAAHRSTPSITTARTRACEASAPAPSISSTPPPPVKPPPPVQPPPVQPPPPTPPPAGSPPPPGSGLMVSLSGSDRNACTTSAPCATFDRAYHQAAPGQAVYVAGGSYPGQRINVDTQKNGAGADVVFLPAGTATVKLAGVSIAGSHVELRNLQTRWSVVPGANSVTLRNVIADGAISITGASNVSVLGGQVYSPVPVSSDPVIASLYGLVPTNILIDGVTFHDFRDVGPGALHHIECLQVGAAINLTIRNSTFYNCDTHDIFIRSWGTLNNTPNPLTNIVIQGNTLAATNVGYYSMQIMDDLWTASPTSFSVLNNNAAQVILVRVTHGTTTLVGSNIVSIGAGGTGTTTSTPRGGAT